MPVDLICPVCSSQFSVPPSRITAPKSGVVCCGAACAGIYKRTRLTITCKTCGRVFERPKSNGGDFCSHTCALDWRWNRSPEAAARKAAAANRSRATSPRPDAGTLRDLYEVQKLTPSQIAPRYTVQPQTVRKWLRDDGFILVASPPPSAKPRFKPPVESLLRNLYCTQRLSANEIGARLGVSNGLVLQWLEMYGIKRRRAGNGLEARLGTTPPTKTQLNRMIHEQGMTYQQVADRYGVDLTAVAYWLDKLGLPRPQRRTFAETHADSLPEICALYESGLSMAAIGERFGVTHGVIANFLREHGIPIRNNGWAGGKRFECSDGHLVRSTYERRVDDWLSQHGVTHSYEPRLPFAPTFSADFLANGWYIEVWGVLSNPEYKERQTRKRELYRANYAPLIELPAHSFYTPWKGLWHRRLQQCLESPKDGIQFSLQFG